MNQLVKFGAIGAGLFLAFRYLAARKKSAKNLRIVPVDIAIDKARSAAEGYSTLYYKVKVNMTNPEQAPVIVRGIDLDVIVKGKQVAKLIKDDPFTVPGRKTLRATLNGSIQIGGVVTTILDLIQNTNKPLAFTLDGFVDTDLGRIPVQFTKNLSL